MSTVFIDVDDTLVLYSFSPTPYGVIRGKPYKPNEALIKKMAEFTGHIIVWSGGGRDYARDVAVLVLPKTLMYGVQTKGLEDFQEGDIIVDDQPEYLEALREIGVFVFNPFEEWKGVAIK